MRKLWGPLEFLTNISIFLVQMAAKIESPVFSDLFRTVNGLLFLSR
jgi:hypothetical protein